MNLVHTQAVELTTKLSDSHHIIKSGLLAQVTTELSHFPHIEKRTTAAGDYLHGTRSYDLHAARAIDAGQVWSEDHAEAFRALHLAYVNTALGRTEGRTAWPLAVGTGKTQSLVAFALAQAEVIANGGRPLSLLICIEKVQHISLMFNDMVEGGVPRELIGVHHRKTPRQVIDEKLVAATPENELDQYPFLIATHATMLKGDDSIALVNTFDNQERNLIVWDESLIKSQGHHFDLALVEGAHGLLQNSLRDTEAAEYIDAKDAAAFIGEALASLRTEFNRTLVGGEVQTVAPRRLTPSDEMRYLIGIGDALRGKLDMLKGSRRTLCDFIEHVQRPVRVVPYIGQGRKVGVIYYTLQIPEQLSRLIILDASHNIRMLTSHHDESIKVTDVDCKVKSFEDVTVRHYIQAAGKEKLNDELPRKDSATTKRLIEILKEYSQDEAVLVVTFKPDPREARLGKSNADHLKRHMLREGIDPEAVLSNGKPRFIFLTWGQHVSTSSYAYADHVLCVGVLKRDELEIASQIAGQRSNLMAPQAGDPAAVNEVAISEMFHNLIQAAGRGACRETINGKSLPMTLTLICWESFKAEWWQEAMPNVRVIENDIKGREKQQREVDAVKAILKVLLGLPSTHLEISTRTLKVAACLQSMHKNVYSKLLAKVAQELPEGWQKAGRSFTRVTLQFAIEEGYTATVD